MKQIVSLLLALSLTLGLSACGQGRESSGAASLPDSMSAPADVQEERISEQIEAGDSIQAGEAEQTGEAGSAGALQEGDESEERLETGLPEEGESYYDLENVVLYLELYDTLPDNFMTKSAARELGWSGGSAERYREGAAIGGDRFGNREGLLPIEQGRSYRECDLNTLGKDSRGAERLVFSSDGLYFYTGDHYGRFTQYIVTENWEVVPA